MRRCTWTRGSLVAGYESKGSNAASAGAKRPIEPPIEAADTGVEGRVRAALLLVGGGVRLIPRSFTLRAGDGACADAVSGSLT